MQLHRKDSKTGKVFFVRKPVPAENSGNGLLSVILTDASFKSRALQVSSTANHNLVKV